MDIISVDFKRMMKINFTAAGRLAEPIPFDNKAERCLNCNGSQSPAPDFVSGTDDTHSDVYPLHGRALRVYVDVQSAGYV